MSSSTFRVIIAALICHSVRRSRISRRRHRGRLVDACLPACPPPSPARGSFGFRRSEKRRTSGVLRKSGRRSTRRWKCTLRVRGYQIVCELFCVSVLLLSLSLSLSRLSRVFRWTVVAHRFYLTSTSTTKRELKNRARSLSFLPLGRKFVSAGEFPR
jgi:hypothetical protein